MAPWTDISDTLKEPLPLGVSPVSEDFSKLDKKLPTPLRITTYDTGDMPKKHEGLLDIGELEANPPAFESDWKPATELRLRTKRGLHSVAALTWKFLSPFWPKSHKGSDKLRRTAYLDGLRGFAAFLVYWHHHELWAHKGTDQNRLFENGFGFEGHYHFAAFPGMRMFFNGGHFAVSIFFVVSGYVLSTKPMSLIQDRELIKLGDNIASALFRRWLRLWIPLMIVTFVFVSSWHALDLWVCDVNPQGNWLDEVWAWYAEMKNFNFVYSGGAPWLSYDMHLWSIPVEFKGSIVIYTSLMALSRVRTNARLLCELALVFYFTYIADAWYCAMFISGMLLNDLDLLAMKQQLPHVLKRLEPAKRFIYYHLLVVSFYLGGVPSHDLDVGLLRKQRGWYYLSLLKPQAFFDYKWFYLLWAAVLLVAAVPRIKWLKAFFETRFCQYLGRISYALYLVHGPVIWTLGDRLYTAVGWHEAAQRIHLNHWANKLELPKTGPLGLEVSFLAPHIVLLPVTIWLAEIVTRAVDEPSVRFSQWLYSRMLPRPPKI
ncbi:acyltransferase [Xylariales sp. AK1849]|nr:acyltransferase [Xylariales sp. AK1849]